MTRQILMMGASGAIGRMVLAHLHGSGPPANLTLQTRRAPLSPVLPSLTWDPLDGPGPLLAWVASHGAPQALVVLSGVTPRTGLDLSLNAMIAERTVAAAALAGVGRVLLASSSAVYGVGHSLSEDAPLASDSAYGRAKIEMEQVARRAAGTRVELCCLRIGNVAGADALFVNARTGKVPLRIDRFPDGHGPLRSYIGPVALTRVVLGLADAPVLLPPVLNIAADPPVRMTDLADAAGFGWESAPVAASGMQDITLDCRKLATLVPLPLGAGTAAGIVAELQSIGAL